MSMRILCVDDDREILEAVSRHLKLEGFEVRVAGDGVEAIRLLGEETFDIALLDIEMPGLNGIEVLRHIRACHLDTQPLMLTGVADLRAMEECAQLGAFDYLSKPYNYHELRDAIDHVLTVPAGRTPGERKRKVRPDA